MVNHPARQRGLLTLAALPATTSGNAQGSAGGAPHAATRAITGADGTTTVTRPGSHATGGGGR